MQPRERLPLTMWLKFYIVMAVVGTLGVGMYHRAAPTPMNTQLVIMTPLAVLGAVGIFMRRQWGLLLALGRCLFFVLVGLSQLFVEPAYLPLRNALTGIAINVVLVALFLRPREREIFAVDNVRLLLGKSMALAIATFALSTLIGPL